MGSRRRRSPPDGYPPKGCACWGCVIALNRAVRRTTNEEETSFVRPQRIAPQPPRADAVEEPRRPKPRGFDLIELLELPPAFHPSLASTLEAVDLQRDARVGVADLVLDPRRSSGG